MISLRGRSVRGGPRVRRAGRQLVAKLHPVLDLLRAPDGHIRDRRLEMANQILGRLKNKLAPYGVEFDVGTPVCFSGREHPPRVRAGRVGRRGHMPCVRGGLVRACACTSTARCSRVRSPCSTERLRIAAEGEVMLF